MKILTVDSIKKHVSYLVADEISSICRPLFKNSQLSFYSYSRYYKNKSFLHLTSNKDLLVYFLENQYSQAEGVITTGINLWENYIPNKGLSDLANYFDCHNGILFCKANPYADYIEYMHFAASGKNHSPIEFYFNNIDLLEQFVLYFKDKAAKLINQADKECFVLPTDPIQSNKNKSHKQCCKFIQAKNIHLNFNSKEIIFSKREYEIISQFAQGKTAKEIAAALNISHRTVEHHFLTAKNKSNCLFRTQLIDMVRKNLSIIN